MKTWWEASGHWENETVFQPSYTRLNYRRQIFIHVHILHGFQSTLIVKCVGFLAFQCHLALVGAVYSGRSTGTCPTSGPSPPDPYPRSYSVHGIPSVSLVLELLLKSLQVDGIFIHLFFFPVFKS